MALKRIQKEIKDIKKSGKYDIRDLREGNSFEQVVNNVKFAGNTYNLLITFPTNYPFTPFDIHIYSPPDNKVTFKQMAYELFKNDENKFSKFHEFF